MLRNASLSAEECFPPWELAGPVGRASPPSPSSSPPLRLASAGRGAAAVGSGKPPIGSLTERSGALSDLHRLHHQSSENGQTPSSGPRLSQGQSSPPPPPPPPPPTRLRDLAEHVELLMHRLDTVIAPAVADHVASSAAAAAATDDRSDTADTRAAATRRVEPVELRRAVQRAHELLWSDRPTPAGVSAAPASSSSTAVPPETHAAFAQLRAAPPVVIASVAQLAREVGRTKLGTLRKSPGFGGPPGSGRGERAKSEASEATATLVVEALDALLPRLVYEPQRTPRVVLPALQAVDAVAAEERDVSMGSSRGALSGGGGGRSTRELAALQQALEGLEASRSSDPRVAAEIIRVLHAILNLQVDEAQRIRALAASQHLRPELRRALGDLNRSILVVGTTYAGAVRDSEAIERRLALERTLWEGELVRRAELLRNTDTVFGKLRLNGEALHSTLGMATRVLGTIVELLREREALADEESAEVAELRRRDSEHFDCLEVLNSALHSTRHVSDVAASSSELLTNVSALLERCENILATREASCRDLQRREGTTTVSRLHEMRSDAAAVLNKMLAAQRAIAQPHGVPATALLVDAESRIGDGRQAVGIIEACLAECSNL